MSYQLTQKFDSLAREARAREDYLQAMAWSTAEDICDAVFKGVPASEGLERFLGACERNAQITTGTEQDAWIEAQKVAKEHFDL